MVGTELERNRTIEKDILRNRSHCKCISFSREVINAICSVVEYANLAATFTNNH